MTAQQGRRRVARRAAPPIVVETGREAGGRQFVRAGPWRLLALGGGGYARQARQSEGGWRVLAEDECIPLDVFAAMLAALQG